MLMEEVAQQLGGVGTLQHNISKSKGRLDIGDVIETQTESGLWQRARILGGV